MKAKNIGVLITNIGTPEYCTVPAIRKYLRNFLGDPRVIKLPKLLRFLILEGFILPTRPKKSLHAYQKIWTSNGSPLEIITQLQSKKLQDHLQLKTQRDNIFVTYGMSYSQPSIEEAINFLMQKNQCEVLIVLPLYPQYSATTTASTFDIIGRYFKNCEYLPALHFINQYADHPDYLAVMTKQIEKHYLDKKDWHLLFSFHGIPQNYADAGDPYQKFCILTANKIAENLSLTPAQWTLAFQSRLGPRTWLKPYTDETLKAFPQKNITKVLTVCPGFASDCLETLEEIAMQNREIFLNAGGEAYHYIPCPNDTDEHIAALATIILEHFKI